MIVISIEAFEKREQMLDLRSKVLKAEEERLSGAQSIDINEARNLLHQRLNNEV